MTSPPVHPDLEPIAWLIGAWRGFGVVGYPTIEEAPYEQEVTFSHDGRPFLAYESRSWLVAVEGGERLRPSARETGWWRPQPDRRVEVLLAHPTGIVEVYAGEHAFGRIDLASDVIARTDSAKEVTAAKRLYGRVDGDLAYAIDLAAVGQPLQAHASARLKRVDQEPPGEASGRMPG